MDNRENHRQLIQTFEFEGLIIRVIQNKVMTSGAKWTTWNEIIEGHKTIIETGSVGRMIMNQFEKSPLYKKIIKMDN